MPSYDYQCDVCKEIQEYTHPMSETMDFHKCANPLCDGHLHKMFRPAATHFKGQGWGKTYRVHTPKGEK